MFADVMGLLRHQPSKSSRQARQTIGRRLSIECLEARTVPSTFTVTTRQDVVDPNDGRLSLREAITRSNHHAGTDIIVLPKGATRMGILGSGEDANASGDFDITDTVLIQGAGAGLTIVDGQQLDRVFDVIGTAPSSIKVVFEGLTISTGKTTEYGGGVHVANADLVLRDCAVSGNWASLDGGGISNGATPGTGNVTLVRTTVARNVAGGGGGGGAVFGSSVLTVNSSTIRRNLADGSGGGINANTVKLTGSTVAGNSGDFGGGVYSVAATLTNCTVSSNMAATEGGGIYAVNKATLTGSTVVGNEAVTDGGGIWSPTTTLTGSTVNSNSAGGLGGGIVANTTATLANSTVSNNIAQGNGGGIWAGTATLSGSTVSGNSSNNSTENNGGGGIFASTANLTNSTLSGNNAADSGGGIFATMATLTNSTLSGNSAVNLGGGIYAAGTATLTKCTVNANSAFIRNGGGIYATTATLTKCTVSSNSAGANGGGIIADTVTLTNSTISGNFAGASGGGIKTIDSATLTNSTVSGNSADGNGGGISAGSIADGATVTMTNCTIAENSALSGGGLFQYLGETCTLKNTLVALNLVDYSGHSPDISGAFTSQGHNLIGDGTGGFGFTDGVNGDIVGDSSNPIDPKLGALKNNGGPTQTMALLAGSPAIDQGDKAGTTGSDQRGVGFTRNKDGNGDGLAVVDIGAFER